MRYLGLDIGSKKIGIAVGEAIASEITTIRLTKGKSFYQEPGRTQAIETIDRLLHDEAADAIVIGLPVNEDGEMTEEANHIKEFGQALKTATDKTIHYVDETLTSAMARDMLDSQDLNPKEIEARVDQLAACLILQQYLEEDALAG